MTNGTAARLSSAVFFATMMNATSVGCGHQASPTAPDPLTPPPASPRIQLSQQSPLLTTDIVPAANNDEAGVYRSEVTMSRTGMASVTLRWANGDFSLQLYVTAGACADITHVVTGGCAIAGKTRPGDRPSVVTTAVLLGDLNTIWVLNPDPFPQDFRVDVDIE